MAISTLNLPHSISPFPISIPLSSLFLSVEWLELRSALTTISVPQPTTSNPQPKPYRIFRSSTFSSVRLKSRYVSIQKNRAFHKASLMMLYLAKSPEIRRFLALIYLSLTSRLPSPRALFLGTYRKVLLLWFYSRLTRKFLNLLQGLRDHKTHTQLVSVTFVLRSKLHLRRSLFLAGQALRHQVEVPLL